ncbi:recombinase family protein [Nocardia gipuzkoensis]|nr:MULTISPECIES: recombinase family protein [Nocardia]MDE1674616.1 recombinase family protein [Nocardia gipuzkoensis]
MAKGHDATNIAFGNTLTDDAFKGRQFARANALVGQHGQIVAEFFDIGQSRSIPRKRRPAAGRLLELLKEPERGFDAVVIGEPQRAFYGNQFGLTFPVFVHYGVQLWVPEVGGPIDPDSEAHDLIMSVFGGMSKGERNRIKIRVRAAMAAQAQVEGRYLGGRLPYGYRLADAGPHPNPGKAADGKRLHTLEPDPVTAPVVQRIFSEYLSRIGIFAIAQCYMPVLLSMVQGHQLKLTLTSSRMFSDSMRRVRGYLVPGWRGSSERPGARRLMCGFSLIRCACSAM